MKFFLKQEGDTAAAAAEVTDEGDAAVAADAAQEPTWADMRVARTHVVLSLLLWRC